MARLAVALLIATALGALRAQDRIGNLAGQLVDADGQPVAAEIIVRWRSHPELPGNSGWSLGAHRVEERVLQADERGRFRFEPPVWTPFLLTARRGDEYASQIFPVLPGEFVRLQLEPGFQFAGGVVDALGAPVAGARVRLGFSDASMWARLGHYGMPQQERETVTGADGQFSIPYEPGYLRTPMWFCLPGLTAETDDGRSSGRPTILRPCLANAVTTLTLGPPARVRIRAVDVGTGAPIANALVRDATLPHVELRTDAAGEAASPYLGGQIWIAAAGYALLEVSAGALADRENEVVARLAPQESVTVTSLDPRLAGHRILVSVESQLGEYALPFETLTAVAADGKVRVTSLPAKGRFRIWVEVDGVFRAIACGDGASLLDTTRVAPPRAGDVRGQVLDPLGVPAAHARVALEQPDWPTQVTWTDRGGRFRLTPAFGSPVRIVAVQDGLGMGKIERVELAPGAPPLTVKLERAAVVEGTVEDPAGKPLADVWVSAWMVGQAAKDHPPGPSFQQAAQVVFTDADGHFRFESIVGPTLSLTIATVRDGVRLRGDASVAVGPNGITAPLKIRIVPSNN